MDEITVLAIDRAEPETVEPCIKLALNFKTKVNAIMLVNSAFKKTPAYKGDETGGFFTEITMDFNDTLALKKVLENINSTRITVHCRMEEAIKDYEKIIPLLNNPYVQSIESLTLSTQKICMREIMSLKYPEICPKYIEIETLEDFSNDLVDNFTFPVIVKPNGLHSSFLVSKCSDLRDLKNTLLKSFRAIESVNEMIYGTGKLSFLIEEMLIGKLYSIDAYVDQLGNVTCLPMIRVITSSEVGRDGFYCYRSRTTPELNQYETAEANLCANKAIAALKLTSSTAHIELCKTSSGWKIIEVGPRIGGGRQTLYMEAYGIDHIYNDLLIHLGEKTDTVQKWQRHAAGFNIYADKEGAIQNIHGIKEALKIKSVLRLGIFAKKGDKSIFASNGGDFLIDGNMSNDDKDILESDVKKVLELIKINVS